MLMVALAALSAASYPFVAHWCHQCSKATQYLLPYADRVGLLYYLILLGSLARFKINRISLTGLFLAAGVHVALLAKLVSLHLLCVPCITCAVAIGIACFIAMEKSTRLAAFATVSGILLIAVTSYTYQKVQLNNEELRTREAIHFEQLDLSATNSLPVYVFEEPTCNTCKEFSDLYEPRLISKYGHKISLHILPAPGSISVPTIVIGGKNPAMFIHKPDWFVLTKAIESRTSLETAETPQTKHL